MPKGRMVNKTISIDETVAELSMGSTLLYTWCIPHLDVEGRILANPNVIQGTVVPYLDYMTLEKIIEYCKEMRDKKLVVLYTNDSGKHQYMQFKGFGKNQKLNKDREAPSRIPPPPGTIVKKSPNLLKVQEGDIVLKFECAGKKLYPLTKQKIEELSADYPSLGPDIENLLKDAKEWCHKAEEKDKKTYRGMPLFFRNWLKNEIKYRTEHKKTSTQVKGAENKYAGIN